MSEATPEDLNIRDVLARIDRNQAETAKLFAEQSKLFAEQRKLNQEAVKIGRDHALIPWQIGATLMVAGGTLVGATVALMRVLGRS